MPTSSIQLADNSFGTLAAGLAVGDTALAFTSGHGARFPAVAAGQVLNCCLLNSSNVLEEIQITAHTAGSDSATIARGANSTTAKAWNAGDRIEARLSSEVLKKLQQEALKAVQITTTDTGLTYLGTMTPAPLGIVTDLVYFLVQTATNQAAAKIALNALTTSTVFDGTSVVTAGAMPLNGFYRFDGTNFSLLNSAPMATDSVAGKIQIATQSVMEAGTSTTQAVTPGRQHFHPSASKAWIKFNGTSTSIGTGDASQNMSAVTDNGAGDWTMNFTVPFSSGNYAVSGFTRSNGSNVANRSMGLKAGTTPSTAAFNVETSLNSTTDSDTDWVSLTFFGDL